MTSWTVALQAPLSMEFPGQEYWSGLPFPTLGDLPDPGITPRSPSLQADSLPSEPLVKPNMVFKASNINLSISGEVWKAVADRFRRVLMPEHH